jgi:hypothetical protein
MANIKKPGEADAQKTSEVVATPAKPRGEMDRRCICGHSRAAHTRRGQGCMDGDNCEGKCLGYYEATPA